GRSGPLVLPGAYQVKLTTGGKTLTEPLVVKLDPRVKTSPADLEKHLKLAIKIRDSITQAHDAVNDIRALRAQIQGLHQRLDGNAQAKELLAAADALNKKMKPVEESLIQVKTQSSEDNLNFPIMISGKLGSLLSAVDSADTAPTVQSYTVYQLLRQQLDVQLTTWKDIQTKDMAALNALARKSKIALVMIPAKGRVGHP
ncbi:MAG: glycosyl hydrolase, partial [Terriglobia bacterium]